MLPDWIIRERDLLQTRYPNDRFEIIERRNEFCIRCHDCPGKLYRTGPEFTLNNLKIHLRNRDHRNNVEKRLNSDGVVSFPKGSYC